MAGKVAPGTVAAWVATARFSPSTSAARSSRSASSTRRAASSIAARSPTPSHDRRRRAVRHADRRDRRARPSVRGAAAVGVGCGGPMTGGGEQVSPLNIPAWRGFPLRARLAGHCGLPVRVDNDAKALARGEGWIGAAAGVRDFIAHGRVDGGRRRHRRRRPAARRRRRERGPRRPRHRRARRRRLRVRRPGLPRGRSVRHRDRAGDGRTRPPRRRPKSARAPDGWSGARSRRSRTCSTCSSRSSAARSRSATATRSSRPRRPRSTRAAASTSPAARGSSPARSRDDGPLVGRRRRRLDGVCR